MNTVLILSRGLRLAPLFKAMASELAKDHRVVVAINTVFPDEETEFWRDTDGATIIDFSAAIQDALRTAPADASHLVRDIERETGITLYKSTSNYQLYRRLYKSYFAFWPWGRYYAIEEDIVREYVGSYLVLSDILDRLQVDVIFYEAIDLISTYVALALACRRQKFAFGIHFAPALGDGKLFLQFGLHRRNILLEHLYRHPQFISSRSRQLARELLARFEHSSWDGLSCIDASKQRAAAGFFHQPGRLLASALRRDTWTHPRRAVEKVKNRLKNRRWLRKNLKVSVPEGRFLLFFMQHQPEASLCSAAPRWVDQDRLIEQMAINAPYGLKIVVKEHPATYGARAQAYFEPLLALPNVVLCHPAADSYELAKRAEAIVAITGSIGLEGILLGKRVAVLSPTYYSFFPGVRELKYPEEIFDALKDVSWDPRALAPERETFAAAYIDSVDEIGRVAPGQKWPPPSIAGPGLAHTLRRTMAFIEQHGLKPRDVDAGLAR